jgi:hypothetical protein
MKMKIGTFICFSAVNACLMLLIPVASFSGDHGVGSTNGGFSTRPQDDMGFLKLPGPEKEKTWLPSGMTDEEKELWEDGAPVWTRGNSEGWEAQQEPQGWAGWTEEQQNSWINEIDMGKQKIAELAKSQGLSEDDLKSAVLSLEESAKKGLTVQSALQFILNGMEKNCSGESLEKATRAIAYGVQNGAKEDDLLSFAKTCLLRGLRGDELALSIYKEAEKLSIKK